MDEKKPQESSGPREEKRGGAAGDESAATRPSKTGPAGRPAKAPPPVEAPLAAGPHPLETVTGPHLADSSFTTRRMMRDVLIGLIPLAAAGIWFFREWAIIQMGVSLITCSLTEWIFQRARRKRLTLGDGSAWITALILAFSLPPRAPIYVTIIGSFVAIALGKMVFGGLGHNIFNPAMVGRAFLMVCFPVAMTSWSAPITLDAMTAATPLAAAKFSGQIAPLGDLLRGNTGGSVGETSAAMVLLGGIWLVARRSADWRLVAGTLLPVIVIAGVQQLVEPQSLGVLGHLAAGSVLFGAFFIVTDPVSTPLTRSGRWIYGLVTGTVIMVIRLFAGYPEGVMYAVLLSNSITPLINRWTQTRPVGGHAVQPAS